MASTLESIAKTLLNNKTSDEIGKSLGVSSEDASAVLAAVLPQLLQGATAQASSSKTQDSFAEALESHSTNYTSDLAKFFKNVDIEDGAKIVGHLLGTDQKKVATQASKKTGIDTKQVIKIAAAAAPLVMTLIGNATKKEKKKAKDDSTLASIAKAALSSVDANAILKALIK